MQEEKQIVIEKDDDFKKLLTKSNDYLAIIIKGTKLNPKRLTAIHNNYKIISIAFIDIDDSIIAGNYISHLGKLHELKKFTFSLVNNNILSDNTLIKILGEFLSKNIFFKNASFFSKKRVNVCNLESLSLSGMHAQDVNDWKVILDSICRMRKLNEVTIKNCNLNSKIFSFETTKYLFVDRNIKRLDLSENPELSLFSISLYIIAGSPLTDLNLSHNKLYKADLIKFSNNINKYIPHLSKLNISNNEISDISFLKEFTKLNSMIIDLRNNNFGEKELSKFIDEMREHETIEKLPKIILPDSINLHNLINNITDRNIKNLWEQKLQGNVALNHNISTDKNEENQSDSALDVLQTTPETPDAGHDKVEESNETMIAKTQTESVTNTNQVTTPNQISDIESVPKLKLIDDSYMNFLISINSSDILIKDKEKDFKNEKEDLIKNIANKTKEYLNNFRQSINDIESKIKSLDSNDAKQINEIKKLNEDLMILTLRYVSVYGLEYKLEQFFSIYEEDEKLKLRIFYTGLYQFLYRYLIGLNAVQSEMVIRTKSWKDHLYEAAFNIINLVANAIVIGTVPMTFGATIAALPFVSGFVTYGGSKFKEILRDNKKFKEFVKASSSLIKETDNAANVDINLRKLAFSLAYQYQEQIIHTGFRDIPKLVDIVGKRFQYTIQKNKNPDHYFYKNLKYSVKSISGNFIINCKGLDVFRKAGIAYLYKNDDGKTMVQYHCLTVEMRDQGEKDWRYCSKPADFGYIYFSSEDQINHYKNLVNDFFKSANRKFHDYETIWSVLEPVELDKQKVEKGFYILNQEITWNDIQKIESEKIEQDNKGTTQVVNAEQANIEKSSLAKVHEQLMRVHIHPVNKLNDAFETLIKAFREHSNLIANTEFAKQLGNIEKILKETEGEKISNNSTESNPIGSNDNKPHGPNMNSPISTPLSGNRHVLYQKPKGDEIRNNDDRSGESRRQQPPGPSSPK